MINLLAIKNLASVLLSLTLFAAEPTGSVKAQLRETSTPRSNGKIAFTSDRDGNPEIYLMNPDGTSPTRLTTNLGRDDYPTWSPDGATIAFIREENGNSRSIWLMNQDGTYQRQIVGGLTSFGQIGPFERFGMSWAPDSTKLAFQNGSDIFVIDTLGNGLVNITNGQFINFEPSWSPDGSRIAFGRSIYSHGHYPDIYIMALQGGAVTQITQSLPYSESTSPDWSPDGSRLTLLSGADSMDNSSLATVNLPAGTPYFPLIYNDFGFYIGTPRWSPDGTKIIFTAKGQSNGLSQIWGLDYETQARTQLTSGFLSNYHPDWQPVAPPLVSVSGRVLTPEGMPIRNVTVSLTPPSGVRVTSTTSSFGLFRFDEVAPGETYTINVNSKRYRFATRSVLVQNDVTLADLIGLE